MRVVKEYSTDPTTKDADGVLPNVTQGTGNKDFERAVFSAKKGDIVGPVKTADGYYVFEVTKTRERKESKFADVKDSIRAIITQQRAQEALAKFGVDYQERWKNKTECASGYVSPDCSNAKQQRNSTVPPGAIPQRRPEQRRDRPGRLGAGQRGRAAAGAPAGPDSSPSRPRRPELSPGGSRADHQRVSAEIPEALARLDGLTRQLRAACPWDREQDERSIVPHTVEEAYELADAAARGDDAKLLDELGDVLFQVHFLSLLLEERGAGDLAQVADDCREKLIRRHPHVFPEAAAAGTAPVEARDAGTVLRNWDVIKAGEQGREAGIFGEVPENLPGPLLARKVQRRAASAGFDVESTQQACDALSAQVERLGELVASGASGAPTAPEPGRTEAFDAAGDLLFAAVSLARKLKVDPELALRASSDRFRGSVEHAEQLAQERGERWADLTFDAKLSLYAQARITMENR